MSNDREHKYAQRDAESLIIIGAFFSLLAVLVLAGMFWETRAAARTVTLAAGLILLLLGIGSVAIGRRLRHPK